MLTHAHCRHPRYEVGLEKLLSAEGQVEGMKAELIALQPELAVAQKETAEALVVIEKSSEEAAAKKLVVEADEVLTPLAYIRCLFFCSCSFEVCMACFFWGLFCTGVSGVCF
jgi:hypothetical protein